MIPRGHGGNPRRRRGPAYLAKAFGYKNAPIVGGVVLAPRPVHRPGLPLSLRHLLAGARNWWSSRASRRFAVVMLICPNWMINKSSNKAWDEYIEEADGRPRPAFLLGLAEAAMKTI